MERRDIHEKQGRTLVRSSASEDDGRLFARQYGFKDKREIHYTDTYLKGVKLAIT